MTNPFAAMRAALAPRGTAGVVNLTRGLSSPFFDGARVAAAIDEAEARVASLAAHVGLAGPLSPLEAVVIELLMRASGLEVPHPDPNLEEDPAP
ncbi:hypothetical protein [Jannaschia formosa]|uniref:hypothetical protein n=1 Tax=Jannaschia formosa TaxID=2259592 RepID=UPI000E1C3367|nr:hypothetical protein [Jannaschia formosa]TFL15962.1 hypothetical protein DR046_22595 [Jannaschia formosa]